MTTLKFAIDAKRYDLAAHILVLSALRVASRNGGFPHARKKEARGKACLI